MIGASFGSVSLRGRLPHGPPAVVFFDRRHPRFWDFSSIVPVDIFRVKSSVNCFFYPVCVCVCVCVEVGITINKLHFVLERAVSSVVGVL